jgi:hypothetical protein
MIHPGPFSVLFLSLHQIRSDQNGSVKTGPYRDRDLFDLPSPVFEPEPGSSSESLSRASVSHGHVVYAAVGQARKVHANGRTLVQLLTVLRASLVA